MDPLIRDISDTARWVAVYRARETDRADAVFRDPYARALAGDRGEQIANALPVAEKNAWAWTARTYLFDRLISRQIADGADLVLNLAAGLDTRPYRLELPSTLRWVEVDLPEILDYKEQVLAGATPPCSLERVRLDLSNVDARRGLFARLGRQANRIVVLSEGLLIYLMPNAVLELGQDLSAISSMRHWAVDIVSPGLLRMFEQQMGEILRQAGAPYLFAPAEGPAFFERAGWTPTAVSSILKTARKLNRLPMFLRMIAMLPESKGPQGSRPWSAVCLLSKDSKDTKDTKAIVG
jgi:methyltransferase (TIGR00027 family)